MKQLFSAAFSLVAMTLLTASAHAQAPTGNIAGRVTSSDGLSLPGVTVTVTSSSLQGERTTVTSELGDYLIPLLPPGTYTVTFELGEFQKVERTETVAGTQRAVVDVTMSIAGVTATVQVVADARPFVDTAQVATNFKQDLMATLPSNRTIDAVLLMAPAVHATGPRGAVSINGGQSYENVYTLNGAIINENIRGVPMTPYIEDALQEISVSSSGISAEYGRFSGGVANAITKSGGNIFSGSFRTSVANDSWRTYNPFEQAQLATATAPLKLDKTVPSYEATAGGPISVQRLWFFSAMRLQKQEATRTTFVTNIPYVRTNDEERYEGKLTYTARPGHAVQGSFLKLNQVIKNTSGSNVMDLQSLVNQGQPQDLYSVHYTGVVRPNFFLEAQYSARHLTFTDTGANTKDLINGTMILDLSKGGTAFRFWSPTFCSGSVCDGDEQRNNSNFVLKGSSFLSNPSLGSHHLVFGYDYFNDNIWANTHLTGSDYRIRATSTGIRDGVLYPIFAPGTSSTSTAIDYNPLEIPSEGSNLRTHSLFFNDTWRPNNHFTVGLGVRFDKSQATDGSGANVGDQGSFSPRLSAIWDPAADGRWAISASYARYVNALTSNLAGSTTRAGNPPTYRWFYQGPAINTDPSSVVPTATALEQLFAWFNANGGTNRRPYAFVTVPGLTMKLEMPLESPYANEYAAGISRTLGNKATVRADGVFRQYKNLYSLRTDLQTGRVTDPAGNAFDLGVVENTDDVDRRYAALVTQGTYNPGAGVSLGGNYTLSRAYGNVEAETLNGPSGASVNNYPEYRRESWNYPEGDLSLDQRHRVRMWATYVVPMNPSAGTVTIGAVQQASSGVPYGALALVSTLGMLPSQGYATPPAALEYYFTDRDAFRTETSYRTDLSVNYAYRFSNGSAFRPELFFRGEVLNLFNQFALCGCGDSVFNNGGASNLTTINTAVTLGPTPFNPYTTEPVEGVNWSKNPNFGRALNAGAYTLQRLFRFSVGVRF